MIPVGFVLCSDTVATSHTIALFAKKSPITTRIVYSPPYPGSFCEYSLTSSVASSLSGSSSTGTATRTIRRFLSSSLVRCTMAWCGCTLLPSCTDRAPSPTVMCVTFCKSTVAGTAAGYCAVNSNTCFSAPSRLVAVILKSTGSMAAFTFAVSETDTGPTVDPPGAGVIDRSSRYRPGSGLLPANRDVKSTL